jgi:hypothetical protein
MNYHVEKNFVLGKKITKGNPPFHESRRGK